MSATKVNFSITELNTKINNLLSNGFKEYLNTWEKWTVNDDKDMNHVIFTCIKGKFSGAVADIYYNETDGRCWIEYSKQ